MNPKKKSVACVGGMVGALLFAGAGALFFFFPSSRESAAPLSRDAARLIDPASWAEERRLAAAHETGKSEYPPPPAGIPSPEHWGMTCRIYDTLAQRAEGAELLPYAEKLADLEAELPMVPVRGGEFLMGSPATEARRRSDEGPQHRVRVDDFWISAIEIPWELYVAFMENGRPRSKEGQLLEQRPDDAVWDLVAQPTVPYSSMNLGMGNGYERGMPAIAMSHYAASKFCEWLSARTGRYYRLPTEAEWEYACRAGSRQAYCYGDGEEKLPGYGWFWNNAHDRYQHVALKKPNAWGIYDMHGNVAEWVLDAYDPQAYAKRADAGKGGNGIVENPLVLLPGKSGRVVRGGSWDDDPDLLRSAARRCSREEWNMQDPQNPKSLWYLTNGGMIGFRVVRPARLPDCGTVHRLWNATKGCY